MPTGITASRTEWLTNAAVDYAKELADEKRYVGVSDWLPQCEVTSRLFEYLKFDEASYGRYQALAGADDATKTIKNNGTVTPNNITHDYRFGSSYTPADVTAAGEDENVVQLRATRESTRIVHLDYEVGINSVMATATQTAAVTAAWGTGSSDPVADFAAAAAAIKLGFIPNKVGLSLDAYRRLRTDSNFIGYVKGSNNSGLMGFNEVAEAIGAIFGLDKPVDLKIMNAVYNSAAPDTANTFTEASAMTSTVCHIFYAGQSNDPEEPSAYKEFYLPADEGVYVSTDTDLARGRTVVAKKLVRKTVLTSDILAYRLTGV